jgi:Pyruvate/2-oxoacid:ferredoxin oxidoreductase gamma subunit
MISVLNRSPEGPGPEVVGSVERELLVTGIGGQGVQLAANVLAHAAMAEGRTVQVFGSYGGMMRGGNTEATVVVADGPIEAPPTISAAWSAILMHHEFSERTLHRLRPGGVALVNSTVFDGDFDRSPYTVVDIPATAIAIEVGNVMAASMVMAGAYVAVTGLVGLPALLAAARLALPSYRAQHVELNERAIEAGYRGAPRHAAPAWTPHPDEAVMNAGRA